MSHCLCFGFSFHRQGEQQPVDDYLGQRLPLIDVMSKFIGALKDHFLTKQMGSHNIPIGDILWVLTVPAIWSDEARHFMRSAAEKVSLQYVCVCCACGCGC